MTYMTHMTHVTGTLAGERAIIVALVYDVSCGFLHRGQARFVRVTNLVPFGTLLSRIDYDQSSLLLFLFRGTQQAFAPNCL